MRLPQRSSKAFTLIELIVVIVILGILALIAVPTFGKVIGKTQDQSTLMSLKGIAREAQALRALDQGATWGNAPQDAISDTSNNAVSVSTSAAGVLTPVADDGTKNPKTGEVTYRSAGDDLVFAMVSPTKRICLVGATTTKVSTGKCFTAGQDAQGAATTSSASLVFVADPAVLGTAATPTPVVTTPAPVTSTPVVTPPAGTTSVAGFKDAYQFGSNDDDKLGGMVIAPDGTTYLVGSSWGAFPGKTLNAGGNDYVADAFVTAYGSDGTRKWIDLLSTSKNDQATGVALGADGTVYVSGYSDGDFDNSGIEGVSRAYVSAYTPSGTLKWRTVVDGDQGLMGYGVAVGKSGEIYLSGNTSSTLDTFPNGAYDAFVARIATDGTLVWAHQYDNSGDEQFTRATVGADGNVYLAGVAGTYPDLDALAAAYRPDGTQIWVKTYKTNGYEDYAGAATSGTTLYAVGSSGIGDSSDLTLTAYSTATGTTLWTRTLDSSDHKNEIGRDVTVASDGTVYVTGVTTGTIDTKKGSSDVLVAAYGPDGTKKWAKQYGTSGTDDSFAVGLNANGSVRIAGQSDGKIATTTGLYADIFSATLS